MISIDREKCVKCRLCIQDCVVKVLCEGPEGFPVLPPGNEPFCIHCQHCLAICPKGALSCAGKTPEQCAPAGEIPDPERMLNLIRQRRSIRRFRPEPVPEEILDKLTDSLRWSPTGCNDHRLVFSLVKSHGDMAFFRDSAAKRLKFLLKSGILGLFYPKYKRYLADIERGEDMVYRDAPHMIVASVPKTAPCGGFDPVIALTQFDLYAQTFGIGTCWCGFALYAFRFSPAIREKLRIPKECVPKAVMLFGYPENHYPRSTAPLPCSVRYVGKKT